jgi:structural maintenance of chromosome 2
MKPDELRSMIEETAGTRMFEQKKQAAQKTIEKKEAKVQEINRVLAEDITPMLEKLRLERAEMIKFMSNSAGEHRSPPRASA